jgi:lysophospholipid hydrolase
MRHPEITIQISRIIASRSTSLQQQAQQKADKMVSANMNLKTVALLPIGAEVPIIDFAERLRDALSNMNVSVTALESSAVVGVLGRHAFSKMAKLKLLSWLTEQEEQYRTVLYVADGGSGSPWTQWCIRQVRDQRI